MKGSKGYHRVWAFEAWISPGGFPNLHRRKRRYRVWAMILQQHLERKMPLMAGSHQIRL